MTPSIFLPCFLCLKRQNGHDNSNDLALEWRKKNAEDTGERRCEISDWIWIMGRVWILPVGGDACLNPQIQILQVCSNPCFCQQMEILSVHDLNSALHDFVNEDDTRAFHSCLLSVFSSSEGALIASSAHQKDIIVIPALPCAFSLQDADLDQPHWLRSLDRVHSSSPWQQFVVLLV